MSVLMLPAQDLWLYYVEPTKEQLLEGKFTHAVNPNVLPSEFIVIDDDGRRHAFAVEYLPFQFAAMHVLYCVRGKFRFTSKLLVSSYIDNGLKNGAFANLLTECQNIIVEKFVEHDDPLQFSQMRIAEAINIIYNHITADLGDYLVSGSLEDYLDVLDSLEVQSILSVAEPNVASLTSVDNALQALFADTNYKPDNPLMICARAGTIKTGNLGQMFGPIGRKTEVDSAIFVEPIMTSFLEGFSQDLTAFIKESRTAPRSLYSNAAHLASTEYMSRRLQTLASYVRTVYPGDCGTTKTIDWEISPGLVKNGMVVEKPDLANMVGVYYVDENKQLQRLQKTDDHLVGKYVRLRSPWGCQIPDPNGLCEVCVGGAINFLTKGTNLGHTTSSALTNIINSKVLATKHFTASADVQRIVVPQEAQAYLTTDPTKTRYKLMPLPLNVNKREIKVAKASVGLVQSASKSRKLGNFSIMDAVEASDASEMDITTLSAISEIIITDDDMDVLTIDLSIDDRQGYFSEQFINFLRDSDRDNINYKSKYFSVDVTNWDVDQPLIALPNRFFNMAAHASEISKLVETLDGGTVECLANPAKRLMKLYRTVTAVTQIPFTVLSILLYASLRASQTNPNLPKSQDVAVMGEITANMHDRSAGAALAYERLIELITNPASYQANERPAHPFDVFINPLGAVRYDRERIARYNPPVYKPVE